MGHETAQITKLISITNADGWWARYNFDPSAPETTEYERVVVWAAVEIKWNNGDKQQRVIGVGAGDLFYLNDFAKENDAIVDLLGRDYFHQNDFAVIGKTLKPFDEIGAS
ncbi:hypothetical protein [Bosea sp. UC22_33]|uniref:hypothetical protein n=1 Tax=Bosea sp. UC22_33 TaxID=3350165 RepID=UPI0036731831